jgi:predicted Zn-dependent peptidase
VLSLGHLGAPRSTRDYFSLLVLNRILGGNFSSRVNMNLRETKGYTYGARTSFDFRKGSGSFAATADVKTAVTKESIEAFIKELNDIRSDLPVTPGELEFAKQGLIRGYPAGFETTGQIATRLSEIALYGLSDDYFNRYIQSVKAVTLDDLHRVAQRYLDPSRLAILVVGDRQVIEPKLREIQGLGETITTVEPGTITVNRGGERTTTMK